jgi:ankyrin repeat protein
MERKRRWELGAATALLLMVAATGAGLLWWQVRQHELNRELAHALAHHDVASTASLVRRGADIRTRGSIGTTVLMIASRPGMEELFHLALARGLDVRAAESNGHSVLLYATVNRNEAAVRELLARGVDPDQATGQGATPLSWAARSGEAGIVAALLKAGADPNLHLSSDESTPLIRAAENGHENVMRLLLEHGADPGAHDQQGLTALDRARRKNRLRAIRILAEVRPAAISKH